MYSDAPRQEAGNADPIRPRPSLTCVAALYLLSVASLVALSLFSEPIAAFLARLFPGASLQTLDLIFNALYYLPFLLLPTALLLRREGGAAVRLAPLGLRAMLGIVVLALAAVYLVQCISLLWMMVLEGLNIPYLNTEMTIPATTQGVMLMVITIGAIPGVCEELFFRGTLLGGFERLGTKRAVILTSVLFALLHGSLAGLPGQLMLGLLMGYLAFAFDSVYASITFHTVYNAAIVLINAYMAGGEVTAEEQALLNQGTFAYMGGWGGVLWIIVYILVLGALVRSFIRLAEQRRRAHGIAAVPPGGEKMPLGAAALLAVAVLILLGVYALNTYAACIAGGAA